MIRRLMSWMSGESRSVDEEAVIWAYRLFLDREPESSAVVADTARAIKSWDGLRRQFTTSDEFRQRVGGGGRPSLGGLEPPMRIEDVRDPSQIARLLDHIAATWTRFGETEPHYSVVTDEKFRPETIGEFRASFDASGRIGVDRLDAALARSGLSLSPEAICVELGCGVGRISAWLAPRCARLIATDISASHLELAREHLLAQGATNVELRRLSRIEDIDTLPPFDLFFSVIVLQHNPPPVIRAILERVFSRLRDGGLAYFQVPTYRAGYVFELDAYLHDKIGKGEMEMHVLPQREIVRIAGESGLDLIEIIEDPYTGMRPGEMSNTFLFRKRTSKGGRLE